MYILEIHGDGTAGWTFDTAEALWDCYHVQNRLGGLSTPIKDFEDFKHRLDTGERLTTEPLTMSLHKCTNCTPGGSCEPMRTVREQERIEQEAADRQPPTQAEIDARSPTMYCGDMPSSMMLGDINDLLDQLEKGEADGKDSVD